MAQLIELTDFNRAFTVSDILPNYILYEQGLAHFDLKRHTHGIGN